MEKFLEELFSLAVIEDKKTGKKDYALYSCLRVRRAYKDITDDVEVFAIRGDDDASDNATITRHVLFNHNADLILNKQYSNDLFEKIEKDVFITIHDDDDDYDPADYEFYLIDLCLTYSQFMELSPMQIENSTFCHKCHKLIVSESEKYSSCSQDGEVSDPTNLEDAMSQMEDDDELGGGFCPHCLTAIN